MHPRLHSKKGTNQYSKSYITLSHNPKYKFLREILQISWITMHGFTKKKHLVINDARWHLLHLLHVPFVFVHARVQRWHCKVCQEPKFSDRPNERATTAKTWFNNKNGWEEINEKGYTHCHFSFVRILFSISSNKKSPFLFLDDISRASILLSITKHHN